MKRPKRGKKTKTRSLKPAREPQRRGVDRESERLARQVIECVRRAEGDPISLAEIADDLGLEREEKTRLRVLVKRLIRQGLLTASRGEGLRIPSSPGRERGRSRRAHGRPDESTGSPRGRRPAGRGRREEARLVEGRVTLHQRGFGFLIDRKGVEEDLFLSPAQVAGILDGDEVQAEVYQARDGRTRGRVVRILSRRDGPVVGRYRENPRGGEVIPDGGTFRQRFRIEETSAPDREGRVTNLREGDVVEIEIVRYPSRFRAGSARVIEILGDEGDPEVEVDRIVRRHGLATSFPDDVELEALECPAQVGDEELAGRRDLRDRTIVTIDGESAQDFDDAVSVTEEASGRLRLSVSIADVAHYVRKDSPLDREARERGTSVYFPNRVIPMLPPRLSNGICSLNPEVDRLTMTVEIVIDGAGEVVSTDFFEAVIRSAARLTYTKVAAVLRGERIDGLSALEPQIRLMAEAMERLRGARRRRGSLDFDLPEPQVMIDITTGEPEAIVRSERNDAHRVIEELMIAANEAVARWFDERRLPVVYRVHAEPDPAKLENFAIVARAFGFVPPASGRVSPLALANFLDDIEGKPAARALNTLLLRSMMRAEYSEENIGHYGLASTHYLHFTSPIRRYPDLIVHRLLKAHLRAAGETTPGLSELADIARSSSATERTATLAEYDVVDYWRARFMADKIGNEYDGYVSGVADFGVFVELVDYFVEGLIRANEISGDHFTLTDTEHALVGRRSGMSFTIGDRVRVAVEGVNLSEGRVDFTLVSKSARS